MHNKCVDFAAGILDLLLKHNCPTQRGGFYTITYQGANLLVFFAAIGFQTFSFFLGFQNFVLVFLKYLKVFLSYFYYIFVFLTLLIEYYSLTWLSSLQRDYSYLTIEIIVNKQIYCIKWRVHWNDLWAGWPLSVYCMFFVGKF